MAASSASTRTDAASADPAAGSAFDATPIRPRPLEYIVPAGLGFVVWSVLVWAPLEIELAAEASRATVILLYLSPLVALAASLFTRSSAVVVFAFLASLGLTFTVMQPLDLRILNTMSGALTMTALVVLFVLGSARWGPRRERRSTLHARPLRGAADRGSRFLVAYTLPRLLLLILLFVVPLHAVYGEAGQAAIAANFVDRQREAMVLIHTVHVFVSVLVAYLFFLSPSINMPIELAELRHRTRQVRHTDQIARSRRNLLLYLAAGLIVLVLFAWLRSRGSA